MRLALDRRCSGVKTGLTPPQGEPMAGCEMLNVTHTHAPRELHHSSADQSAMSQNTCTRQERVKVAGD